MRGIGGKPGMFRSCDNRVSVFAELVCGGWFYLLLINGLVVFVIGIIV